MARVLVTGMSGLIGAALRARLAGVKRVIFFVASDNTLSYRDLSHARAVVGYVPADRAEDHRP